MQFKTQQFCFDDAFWVEKTLAVGMNRLLNQPQIFCSSIFVCKSTGGNELVDGQRVFVYTVVDIYNSEGGKQKINKEKENGK